MDNKQKPQYKGDMQASVNPYEIPKKIWAALEEYFEKKYGVEFVEEFPRKEVTTPVIGWRIYRRDPGSPTNRAKIDEMYSHQVETTADGYVREAYVQEQLVIYEYNVWAVSADQADEIAWDLERAILACRSLIQSELPKFQLHFLEQVADSSLQWRLQEALTMRTIRFRAVVPITYIQTLKALKTIELEERWGRDSNTEDLQRVTSAKEFYVTDKYPDLKVVGIDWIAKRTADGDYSVLEEGIDYFRKIDSRYGMNTAYIEWNDAYGNVPSVGETFRITYSYTTTISSHKLIE